MILVVADTTPLWYLVQIGLEDLLPRLFTKVWIPVAVLDELTRDGTPAAVCRWAKCPPPWVEVRNIASLAIDGELAGLDRGEQEAIQLAKELKADLLLIDERSGARVARRQGFTVTGTLGVLVKAAQLDLIPIEEALGRLQKTNFRRTPKLFAETRELVRKLRRV